MGRAGWLTAAADKAWDTWPLGQIFDDLDEFIGSESLPSGKVHQLASPNNDSSAFRGARNRHTPSSTELQETFLPQQAQRTEHRI